MTEELLENISIDQLERIPYGGYLKQAIKIFEKSQAVLVTITDDDSDEKQLALKSGTVLTLALLGKMQTGKQISELDANDLKDVANAVVDIAVLNDDGYSTFVFEAYSQFIEYSAETLRGRASDKVVESIKALSADLHHNKESLKNGEISESNYIEGCLWICLEGMIKLIAASLGAIGGSKSSELSSAVAMLAFEYGRYKMYKKEQEILTMYLDNQKILDDELEAKYNEYIEELNCQEAEFEALIKQAFDRDFRNTFKNSADIARFAGVDESEIFDSVDQIDAFFM